MRRSLLYVAGVLSYRTIICGFSRTQRLRRGNLRTLEKYVAGPLAMLIHQEFTVLDGPQNGEP